ncbi:unnamed protein product [Phytophthora lilii]|uniref:Unnamed protein product n=1 Tax=Phytophthora lilii TaxID=2077276 RepID=A0A9W6X4F7_9STRA|nr:unnamed protein product [Phytophthora lilii]
MYADGMELLMDIAATRRRLRKLRLTIDSRAHNQRLDVSDDDETQDNVMMQLQEDQREVEAELEVLLAQSPAAKLQSKCAEFFPTLLQGLDVRGTSGLSELQGLGYFPMDQPTFLALQTFVNGFRTELKLSGESAGEDKVESLALFFKGNLLWSSMETTTMPLLYKFLRLREERGMTMLRDDYNRDEDCDEPYPDKTLADGSNPQLWMVNAYNDTFLPIWSSKLSYAECDAVTQSQDGPPHARRAARSLHKQHPVSLSTFLSEAPPSSSGGNMMTPISAPRSTAAAESSPFGSPSHSPASSGRIAPPRSNGASPATSESAIKARARSIAFRNAGLLLKNGCFSKLQLASRMKLPENAQDEVQAVWSPFVFPFDDEVAFGGELPPAAIEPTTANDRVVVWHEADLTMLIHLRTKATELDPNNSASDSLNVATLERLERYLDGQQRFQNLAELILSRYNATFAPEKKYASSRDYLHTLLKPSTDL